MKQFFSILGILIYPTMMVQGHGPTDHGEAHQLSRALAQNNTPIATPSPRIPSAITPSVTAQPDTPSAAQQPNAESIRSTAAVPSAPASNDGVRVTVLGYHHFSKTKEATEMIIPTEKFRNQMLAIKELGLNVISLEDFTSWKRGEKKIQDKSVLITIDDGWKSVYTDAYPILKELDFPFTIFLYTNYIDGGASALTIEMIKEMQKHGCSIGSHSVSHPYPATVKAERAKGSDAFASYLQKEMGESRKTLERQFGGKVRSYAYPGGFFTGEMLPIATESGYECLFTVMPGKAMLTTSSFTLPRYVILGTHDYIFRNATSFKATSSSVASDGAIVQSTLHPVQPEPGALISTRLPIISVDLSNVEEIDEESIVMRVRGFAKVPASYDALNKTLFWKVNRPLRARTCEVSVRWRTMGATEYEQPMTWIFRINREASYQPQ